jgi:hypothetical protein
MMSVDEEMPEKADSRVGNGASMASPAPAKPLPAPRLLTVGVIDCYNRMNHTSFSSTRERFIED